MELFAILSSLLFLGLPIYYTWLVILGWGGTARIPVWAASCCLGLWLLQLPIMAAVGLGCAGGGCSGARSTAAGLVLLFVFNAAPLWWLTKSFPKKRASQETSPRDPLQLADEARGFPAGFNPGAEAGSFSSANAEAGGAGTERLGNRAAGSRSPPGSPMED